MAIHKLRPRQIETAKSDGMLADGGGLYLQVQLRGRAKSWIFRYSVDGRERSMGLGSLDTVTLDEARERALQCRKQRLDGIDPIEARKAAQLDHKLAQAREVTFRKCAEDWMTTTQEITWTPKHAKDPTAAVCGLHLSKAWQPSGAEARSRSFPRCGSPHLRGARAHLAHQTHNR